jgi:RNA polymerase sigma-70 factor (ECF subfamily)
MYIEEYSVVEVASLVGWSKTMVKVQAYRARAKLRKLIDSQERSQ